MLQQVQHAKRNSKKTGLVDGVNRPKIYQAVEYSWIIIPNMIEHKIPCASVEFRRCIHCIWKRTRQYRPHTVLGGFGTISPSNRRTKVTPRWRKTIPIRYIETNCIINAYIHIYMWNICGITVYYIYRICIYIYIYVYVYMYIIFLYYIWICIYICIYNSTASSWKDVTFQKKHFRGSMEPFLYNIYIYIY